MNLSKVLNQTAVYWAPLANDGWGGKTYAAPVEVAVRWTDKQEKFISGSGEEEVSRTVILAETDFEIDGRMLLASLIALDSAQDPNEEGAAVIKAFTKIPPTEPRIRAPNSSASSSSMTTV